MTTLKEEMDMFHQDPKLQLEHDLDALYVAKVVIEGLLGINISMDDRASDALMITDAINHAAKVHDDDYYNLKEGCIRAAMHYGCNGGWIDDVFYLHTEAVGTASFHCGYALGMDDLEWKHPWTGVRRQCDSFKILTSLKVREFYRAITCPTGSIYGCGDRVASRAMSLIA